ncbi:hypothetical protein GGI26_002689 [Coemansia sp. RSA 1358]|nr:hypothetical protein GGI26_002689 [Coemansia sp. RSA 1358]
MCYFRNNFVSSIEAANSPLGMLAAIASPSPTTKVRPPSRTSALVGTTATGTSQPGSTLKSSKLEAGLRNSSRDTQSNSGSASPPPSPSTIAAMRKGISLSGSLVATDNDDDSRKHSPDTSAESSATVPLSVQSPTRPSAIPTSQLDVLALVTATSPPMPSRRRWINHGTSKPMFSNPPSVTPSNRQSPTEAMPALRRSDSGSDTESEDEVALRSHSARIRSRYHTTQFHPLPLNSDTGNEALSFKPIGTFYPTTPHGRDQQHQGLSTISLHTHSRTARPSRHTGTRKRKGDSRSSGNATDTDEERQSNTMTPVSGRVTGSAATHARNQHLSLLAHSPHIDSIGLSGDPGHESQVAPASEPAMHRRSRRRRLHGDAHGVVLSKQLSKLAEETEDIDAGGTIAGEPSRSRETSLSLSSPSSPSRKRRMRTKRVRNSSHRSGSETETDTELASRLPGSETETDRSNSNGNTLSNGNHVNGRANITADMPNGAHRRLTGSSTAHHAMPPIATSNRARGVTVGSIQRPVLPPITQIEGYAHPRQPRPAHGAIDSTQGGNDSDGETTDTDDDFFGLSRSFHSSIRPPRRVIRHLASLRAQHSRLPAALQLNGPRPMALLQAGYSSYSPASSHRAGHYYNGDNHPRTAPIISGTSSADDTGFGLGISSVEGDRARNNETAPQSRVLSTPEAAAGPAISSAIRDAPLPPPRAFQDRNYLPHHGINSRLPHNEDTHALSSSMRREFARDPFAPVADEFTYRGAALRRLEKSYVRGNTLNGQGSSSINRKRALTAPSSFEPPVNHRSQNSVGGRAFSSGELLLEDEPEESSRPRISSIAGTPPERNQPLDTRVNLLGVSPVSSLRSSLLGQQQHRFSQAAPDGSASQHYRSNSSVAEEDGEGNGLHERPGSPSMDAALRRSRKRQHSSGAKIPELSSSPSLHSSDSNGHSPSSRRRLEPTSDTHHANASPPKSDDVLFSPIDSESSSSK